MAPKCSRPAALLTLLVCLTTSSLAYAASFPTKLVTIVVHAAPGGPADIIARLMEPKLREKWGQPVVIANKPGASGLTGTEFAARAKPDGHTIILGTSGPFAISVPLSKSLPYDPVKDFAPITLAGNGPMVLAANPAVPAETMAELLHYARSNPGKLNYGVAGTNGLLAGELLNQLGGVNIVEVQYAGAGPSEIAVLRGEVQLTFTTPATMLQFKGGEMKRLGVTTSRRSSLLPEIPTINEGGVTGYDLGIWYAFFAPAQTPADVVDKLRDDLTTVLQTQDLQNRLTSLGIEPMVSTSIELKQLVEKSITDYSKIVRASGIEPQ
jgi:tripartite-type tricarboxylate transporter receptor subunit TctC